MKFKEFLFTKLFTLRHLFLWGNILLLLLFLIVCFKDQERDWPAYQKQYKEKELARIETRLIQTDDSTEKDRLKQEIKSVRRERIALRQLWVQELGAVDRCITCHLGFDPIANASLTTEYSEHPFKAPANSLGHEIHKLHNLEKFGCVVCHGGQGLATDVEPAHGYVPHWEKPLLEGILLQSSCFKCHDNVSDLQVKGKNYTEHIVRGEALIQEQGCLGCHQIDGKGGPISVDFKDETSVKPNSRIDFYPTGLDHKDWTLANWIKIHLTRNPETFVPGDPRGEFNTEPIAPSGMPAYMLSDEKADSITAFILGLNRESIPSAYLTLLPPKPEPNIRGSLNRGQWVYKKYGCAGCHGPDARGGIKNFNYQYDVIPNLRRAVSTYTRDQLREKISKGVPFVAQNDPNGPRPPLYMPAWEEKIKGRELEDLISYLLSIKE